MFKLRQSLQGIAYYLKRNDQKSVLKWATALEADYATLPTMVPEWASASRQSVARSLRREAEGNQLQRVGLELKRLEKFCDACHQQWQPVVAVLYRSPNFASISVDTVESSTPLNYSQMMQRLSDTLGILKINRADGDYAGARNRARQLERQLDELSVSCSNCHDDVGSEQRIFDLNVKQAFVALQQSLAEPHDSTVSGRQLGEIGYRVCGRCHGIHRSLGDIRHWLETAPGTR